MKPILQDLRPGHTLLRRWILPLGLLAAMCLGLFFPVLFQTESVVLSHQSADLAQQFLHWRAFGFGELRQGNLALWNPHLYSGTPFFGGFQSALLYPLNFPFLVMPLERAVNWSIALHVFLAGAFTYIWAVRRGLQPAAAFLAGNVFMFCGAHFLHIYAGHLPNLCSMVWAPLLFIAIDGLFEQSASPSAHPPAHPIPGWFAYGEIRWSLLGAFAVAMQILAGHPQYVYYTGVAAAVYVSLCWIKARRRRRFTAGLAAIVAGGAGLSAVQLFTSLGEASEMLRSGRVPYDFAAAFSFPPENLLTLIAPDVFGETTGTSYWGRWYFWEMSFFIGATGFVLAVLGSIHGPGRTRRFSVTMTGLLVLLALGSHTPLFKALYTVVPGFDLFRGSSKFLFLASLFLALLAGIGLDALLKGAMPGRRFLIPIGVAALMLTGLAIWAFRQSPDADSGWRSLLLLVRQTPGEGALPMEFYDDPAFLGESAVTAGRSLLLAAMMFGAVIALILLARRWRAAAGMLLVLAISELVIFAGRSLETFRPRDPAADPAARVVNQVLANQPGDYRVFNTLSPNSALTTGAREIWGFDPGVLRRYADVIGMTQGISPDEMTQYVSVSRDHPLLGMLQCRFMFFEQGDQLAIYERRSYLPRLLLVPQARIMSGRDSILAVLGSDAFDPRQEVILETSPQPPPQPSNHPGTVALVDSSTDHLTIEANVETPAILLIADTYARGWRARPLAGSVQSDYTLLPANYCLRAIPLGAGSHRLRVEYVPPGFTIGKWISLLTAALFILFAGLHLRASSLRPASAKPRE